MLCHAPPSLPCFWRCYAKPITSTLVKLKICRTFTKTRFYYPICELYYLINNQSNHVSLEVEYCVKFKNTAAVMWTTLQTSMDMTLDYIFVIFFSVKLNGNATSLSRRIFPETTVHSDCNNTFQILVSISSNVCLIITIVPS
jgi:hypothetical protein